MAARSRMAAVKQEAVNQTISLLIDLPAKPKDDLSLREAVQQMQIPLKSALVKGYSYADLAQILTDRGISISALTLKNYLPLGKRQSNKPTRKSRKTLREESATTANFAHSTSVRESAALPASAIATADNAETSPLEAISAPPPASSKGRRGRPKATAKATAE